jgi:methylenetetrahydrofolate--tRNA-(uracil-5-)-methyltransferase
MRPVGLRDPHTGRRPHSVLQLRQDNLANTLYNLVGFQTNLTFGEQKRVFHLIPGLEHAEFVRYGQMHRNTFLFSPTLLDETLQFKTRPDLFFAGQIVGVEGYIGNVATGLVAGINAANYLHGEPLFTFPQETMTGALLHYITHASPADFQPMKANFGILPKLSRIPRSKKERALLYAGRALAAMRALPALGDK